mmetsp:Transcript_15834/g.19630  ORF Transcript_15834/g.19630 Transcript_15834/m.19630 type:complete len:201 (+) Transcript_15834:487-1089(+)
MVCYAGSSIKHNRDLEVDLDLKSRFESMALVVHPNFLEQQRQLESEARERLLRVDIEKYRSKSKGKSATNVSISLPEEIADIFFAYLGANDLARIATVSKYWYFLSIQDKFWKRLIRSKFNMDMEEFKMKMKCNREIENHENEIVQRLSQSLPAKTMYKQIELTWRKHTESARMAERAQMLSHHFNIPNDVALGLLRKYT